MCSIGEWRDTENDGCSARRVAKADAITGYRWVKVESAEEEVRLRPLVYDDYDYWAKRMRADRAPNRSNENGLYAFKSLKRARTDLPGTGDYVLIEVRLYGRVATHTHGYRASHAEVVRVIEAAPAGNPMTTIPNICERAAEALGVPYKPARRRSQGEEVAA